MTWNRVIAVVRLHLVNLRGVVVLPWMIMGIIFVINLSIWAIIYWQTTPNERAHVSNSLQWSGSSLYIFVYMMVFAVQSIAITFPFALGYGVTRRHFALGTAVAYVVLALVYSIALTLLAALEQATHGWGFGGHMFTAIYFGSGPWPLRFFVYFVLLLAFFFLGGAMATVWVRWKGLGLIVAFTVLGVCAIGLVAYAVVWPEFASWLESLPQPTLVSLGLAPTALAAITGYVVLRRTTAKA